MILFTPDAAQALAAHAEQIYPDECVGLLLGQIDATRKIVQTVYPVENRWAGQVVLAENDSADSRRDRFYLDPRDYLRADRAARAAGLDIVGCYHSHPDDVPRPSARDLTGAQGVGGGSGFAFVIQSVRSGHADALTSWLLVDDGTRFAQEELLIEGD